MAAVRDVLGSKRWCHAAHHLEVVAALGRSAANESPMANRHRPLLALHYLSRLWPASGFVADLDDEV